MRRVCILLSLFAVLAGTVAVRAQEAAKLGVWNEAARKAWWREHADGPAIVAGAKQLQVALQAAEAKQGTRRVLSNKHFMAWLGHWRWVSLLPADLDADEYFADAEHQQQFRNLALVKGLPELVVRSMSTKDDGPRVAQVLCEIAAAYPRELKEFPHLAAAFAVVFDRPFPKTWPHPNVAHAEIPVGDRSAAARFGFWVKSQQAGKLLIDPRSLTVRELTFAVDTPVELRELAYAQQIKLGNISKLEGLYRAVPYDQARINKKNYNWQRGSYRLVEIGTKGGICMDQAYFVGHAGKALGVPTVLFMGQGRSGDHAWVGFLTGRGRWTLDAARWRGENYPTGYAFDPQTWSRFTDAQMEYSVKGEGDSSSVARARLILAWADQNRDQETYRPLLHAAQGAAPRWYEPWQMEADWLAKKPADKRLHPAFWQRWIANFSAERDLKAKGQRALLRVLRDLGDDGAAERLSKQVIAENKSKRFDLGIAVAADVVFDYQAKGDWEAAAKEYQRVMKRFQRNAGGHLFYNLVQPYVQTCLREGKATAARSAMGTAEETLKPQPSSILANDLKALREEVR